MLQGRHSRSVSLPARLAVDENVLRLEMAPQAEGEATDSNEAAAIATLKNISSSQAQFQAMAAVDVDGDRRGEYGYFGELSGGSFLRALGGRSEKRMSPPVLSAAFSKFQTERSPYQGVVLRSGYCFQIFLPDVAASGVPESASGGVGVRHPDPDQAESRWCCYAWPVSRGESGTRAFFVNQGGDILACENKIARYSGWTRTPRAVAAYSPEGNGTMAAASAPNAVGFDGEKWTVVN